MRLATLACRTPALITGLLAGVACGILEPGGYAALGVIILDGDTVSITMPDTVVAGESFTVLLHTWGLGCTRRADRTEVVVGLRVAEILPYDWTATGKDVVCPSDGPRPLEHSVNIRFAVPGHATVRIHGRDSYDWPVSRPTYLDREIVVR